MDGKRLSRQLRQMLNEESGSNYLDSFTSFDLLNQGAQKLNNKLEQLETAIEITTVADQADYTLPANFTRLVRVNGLGRGLIRFDDGAALHNIIEKDDDLRYRNKAFTVTSANVPSSFAIVYDDTEDTQVTGTETTGGSLVAGKATLIDSTAPFADVEAGDTVHNTTDGAMGVVLSKTSSSQLITAMFDGTNNFWTSADAYVIQPQAKYKLTLDPPPDTSSLTVTVDYLRRPKPVYSDFDSFQFPIQYQDALVFYAVGFNKYRHQMIDEGNTWFAHADLSVRESTKSTNQAFNKRRAIVNFKKRQRNY